MDPVAPPRQTVPNPAVIVDIGQSPGVQVTPPNYTPPPVYPVPAQEPSLDVPYWGVPVFTPPPTKTDTIVTNPPHYPFELYYRPPAATQVPPPPYVPILTTPENEASLPVYHAERITFSDVDQPQHNLPAPPTYSPPVPPAYSPPVSPAFSPTEPPTYSPPATDTQNISQVWGNNGEDEEFFEQQQAYIREQQANQHELEARLAEHNAVMAQHQAYIAQQNQWMESWRASMQSVTNALQIPTIALETSPPPPPVVLDENGNPKEVEIVIVRAPRVDEYRHLQAYGGATGAEENFMRDMQAATTHPWDRVEAMGMRSQDFNEISRDAELQEIADIVLPGDLGVPYLEDAAERFANSLDMVGIGAAGQEAARDNLIANGWRIEDEQARIVVPMPDGSRKVRIYDFIAINPSGQRQFIEVKTNGAVHTQQQKEVDAQFALSGGLIGSSRSRIGQKGDQINPTPVHDIRVTFTTTWQPRRI